MLKTPEDRRNISKAKESLKLLKQKHRNKFLIEFNFNEEYKNDIDDSKF
jgi:hypothetical protein